MAEKATAGETSIEQITIQRVPDNARTGKARHLFPIWFGVQIMPLTLVTGVLGPTVFGINLWWSIVAIVAGNLVGAIFMALHSAQGPRLGVPQMVQSRGQFGMYGSLLVLVVVILMYLGFLASILVLAAQSLGIIFPSLGGDAGIVISAALTLALVVFGYQVIHKLNRILLPLFSLAVVGTFVAIVVAMGSRTTHLDAGGFHTAGFFGMFSAAAVWQLAYAPYVSDYSRYLPSNVSTRATFHYTFWGTALGAVPVMIIGALLPTGLGGAGDLSDLNGTMPKALLYLVALMFFLGAVDACVINLYGPALCVLTVGQTLRSRWRPGAVTRSVIAAVFCALATVLATVFAKNFLTQYSNFILFLLYFLIPWSVINLVDYYIVHRGDYDVDSFFRPDGGIYGRYIWPSLIGYVLGVAVQIPFMSTTFYTGPIAKMLDGVDTAWIAASIATFFIYLGMVRLARSRAVSSAGPLAEAGAPITGALATDSEKG